MRAFLGLVYFFHSKPRDWLGGNVSEIKTLFIIFIPNKLETEVLQFEYDVVEVTSV